MECTGKVEGGVVVFDSESPLAEGTVVRIVAIEERPTDKPAAGSTLGEMLLSFAGKAAGLPADMAKNHDHYLYGVPKK